MSSDKKTLNVDEDEYKGLLAKNAAQKTKILDLETQLKDSTEALLLIKTKMDAAEKEEKEAVIAELVRDSQGKLTIEALKDHDLKELYFLKNILSKAQPTTFISVMKQREEDAQKVPAKLGTVGSYDQSSGKYVGGLDS